MTARAITYTQLLEQLGRHWAEASAGAVAFEVEVSHPQLSFVEAASPTPGHIYTGPLPPRASRAADNAASITLVSGPTGTADGPRRSVVVRCLAQDRTEDEALSMVADFERILLGVRRAFTDSARGGFIGLPALEQEESSTIWRVLEVEVVSPAQISAFANDPGSEGDGLASAEIVLAVHAIPLLALHAFDLWNSDGALEIASALIEWGMAMRAVQLQWGPTVGPLDTAGVAIGGTVAQLADAIEAVGDGWTAQNRSVGAQARAASSALGAPLKSVKGEANRMAVLIYEA